MVFKNRRRTQNRNKKSATRKRLIKNRQTRRKNRKIRRKTRRGGAKAAAVAKFLNKHPTTGTTLFSKPEGGGEAGDGLEQYAGPEGEARRAAGEDRRAAEEGRRVRGARSRAAGAVTQYPRPRGAGDERNSKSSLR